MFHDSPTKKSSIATLAPSLVPCYTNVFLALWLQPLAFPTINPSCLHITLIHASPILFTKGASQLPVIRHELSSETPVISLLQHWAIRVTAVAGKCQVLLSAGYQIWDWTQCHAGSGVCCWPFLELSNLHTCASSLPSINLFRILSLPFF